MGVYLRAKSEVSSIILTSFRLGGGCNFTPPPYPPQNEPLRSPPRLSGLSGKAILGPNITPIQSKSQRNQCEF